MIRKPVTVSREAFDAVWEAAKLAAEAGAESFTVTVGRSKFHFNTEEAINLCNRLEHEFKKPKKVYPENREGPEPP